MYLLSKHLGSRHKGRGDDDKLKQWTHLTAVSFTGNSKASTGVTTDINKASVSV